MAGLVPDAVLIGLGDRETQMSATDFTESGLAALIPDARVLQLARPSTSPRCRSASPRALPSLRLNRMTPFVPTRPERIEKLFMR